MRWHVPLLFLALVAPLVLAGCTNAPEKELDPAADLGEDEAFVRIHVKTPMGVQDSPVWKMKAVPRLVAFLAADNDTRERLGDAGYVDAATGWAGWDADEATTEYPASAVRDWLRPSALWYEGVVPAGNYSTIRIEIVELEATDAGGFPLDVVLMGDRLSIGPTQGEAFHIAAGDTATFVFESVFDEPNEGRYMIR